MSDLVRPLRASILLGNVARRASVDPNAARRFLRELTRQPLAQVIAVLTEVNPSKGEEMKLIATKRAVLHRAWLSAKRRIEREGVTQLSPDEEAGRLLEKHESANVAFVLCTLAPAQPLLAAVVEEEGGEILPAGRSSR